MKKSFEQHPTYKEKDLEIKTPKELEEAKKEAGVTTHEKAMIRAKELGGETKDKRFVNRVAREQLLIQLEKGMLAETVNLKENIEKELKKLWEQVAYRAAKFRGSTTSTAQIYERTGNKEKAKEMWEKELWNMKKEKILAMPLKFTRD